MSAVHRSRLFLSATFLLLQPTMSSADLEPIADDFERSRPTRTIVAAELAGNSLIDYPHFEFVKAFNENMGVEVAVDPTRHPAVVGLTGDIYVVEAKSVEAWQADPRFDRPNAGDGFQVDEKAGHGL